MDKAWWYISSYINPNRRALCALPDARHETRIVNPLYNNIRCNSKIRYDVYSVCSKISGSCIFFIDSPIIFFRKTYVFVISNKYTKRMIHKKMFKSIQYSCFRRVHIKVLYNSKFDLTAKSLVTNSVVITRVHCIMMNVTIPKLVR